jgi:hypothetical protein
VFTGNTICRPKTATGLVGEAGHYLNRPGELRGGVLELIRAHRDRLEGDDSMMVASATMFSGAVGIDAMPGGPSGLASNRSLPTVKFAAQPRRQRFEAVAKKGDVLRARNHVDRRHDGP